MEKEVHSKSGFRWLTGSPILFEDKTTPKLQYPLQKVNPVQKVTNDIFPTLEEKEEVTTRSVLTSNTPVPRLSSIDKQSVKSYSPVRPKVKILPPKEIKFKSQSIDNSPEVGTHSIWRKVSRNRYSEMSDSFIEFYKSTYANSFIGQQKGIDCVIPIKLNASAIASHKWWSQSSRRRFQSYHFESRDLDTSYSLIQIQDKPLSSLLSHMKGTEHILRQDNAFRRKLRPLKDSLKKSYKKSQIGQKLPARIPAKSPVKKSKKSKIVRMSRDMVPRSSIKIESACDNHSGFSY